MRVADHDRLAEYITDHGWIMYLDEDGKYNLKRNNLSGYWQPAESKLILDKEYRVSNVEELIRVLEQSDG